jgi:hypothetical protein
VIAFNRLFKRTRDRRGYAGSVKASWINIAFSYHGLKKLTAEADAFTGPSFKSGVVAQSGAATRAPRTPKGMSATGSSASPRTAPTCRPIFRTT